MTPVWATVALALGAAAITALAGFGTIWIQQHWAARNAIEQTTSTAYQMLIAHSLSFVIRAQTLQAISEQQSGVADRVEVEMRGELGGRLESHIRTRPPLDLLGLHDWLAISFDPVNESWATVKVFGSPAAIEVSDSLVSACSKCLGAATQVGAARDKVSAVLFGAKWTPEQRAALQTAIEAVVKARDDFVALANREFGGTPRRRSLHSHG